MKAKWIGGIIVILVAVPIAVGVVVSTPGASWLETSNDWIGFWGGYFGSIIGGLITLFVMNVTIIDSRISQEKIRRQELCARTASLVSNFCIEMMAYRSKWNALYKEAEGKNIDALSKIEIGATTEEPRRIYFELEILLGKIREADSLVLAMKSVLDGKLTKKSVKEAEEILSDVREKAKAFIETYSIDFHG